MAKSTFKILVLIAATFVTSVTLAAQKTYDTQLAAPPGGQLTFDSNSGSVTVTGHNAPEVTIHAELKGSRSFLSHFHIKAQETPSGVRVTARAGRQGWLHWFYFSTKSVRFAIEVPRDYPVDLTTAGGDVNVQNLNAAVHARTSGGRAVVQNIVGSVNLRSSGGDVEAAHVNGPARLVTSGGNIRITDSTGTLDLRTSGGDILIRNDEGRVRALTSGGDITAQLRANHGVRLTTSGGDVTLLLPRNTHASIKAAAIGGHVTCNFPLSTVRISGDNRLKGTIGGGGAPIVLKTAGGDIKISPRN